MSIIRSMFEGYRESESVIKRNHDRQFEELEYYPMLFSSQHLTHLYYEAETPEECDQIMAYMFRFKCVNEGIHSYDEVFGKLNKKYKRLSRSDE